MIFYMVIRFSNSKFTLNTSDLEKKIRLTLSKVLPIDILCNASDDTSVHMLKGTIFSCQQKKMLYIFTVYLFLLGVCIYLGSRVILCL